MHGMRFLAGICGAWAFAHGASDAPAQAWSGPEARLPELGARLNVAGATTLSDGTRDLSGVTIERGGRVIDVNRMRWTGREVFMDRVEARHAEGPDGRLLAARVVLRGVGSWHVFFAATGAAAPEPRTTPSCAEMAGRTSSMEAADIVLTGDDDALPSLLGEPERLTVARLVALNEVVASKDGCDWSRRVGLDDVAIVAITGAHLRAAKVIFLGFAREALPAEASGLPALEGTRLTAEGLSLHDSAGLASARMDSLRLEWAGDAPMSDVRWLRMADSEEDAGLMHQLQESGLLDAMMSAGVTMEGIEIDADRFLPSYMPHRGPDRIAGNASLVFSLAERRVETVMDVDLPAFLDLHLAATIGLPETGVASRTAVQGIPADILGLTIHGLAFRFQDGFAGDIVEGLTGETLADHLRRRLEIVALSTEPTLPSSLQDMLDSVGESVVGIIENGGAVHVSPESPVTMAAALLLAAARPERLPDLLNLQVRINGQQP